MIRCLLFISLLIHASLAKKQAPQAAGAQAPVKKWQTLSGNTISFPPSFDKQIDLQREQGGEVR